MPYFVGVTPLETGEPITISSIWIDGTTRSTRLNLPVGSVPSSADVGTFASKKMELSNMGLFKWLGVGQAQSIPRREALVYDENYGIGTTMLCEFESASDASEKVYDRIPAPNLAFLTGYALDTSKAEVLAYTAATEAILNSGGLDDYAFAGSVLEGVDAEVRTIPNVLDPASPGDGDPV